MQVLQLLHEIITNISGRAYVTISRVLPHYFVLKNKILTENQHNFDFSKQYVNTLFTNNLHINLYKTTI